MTLAMEGSSSLLPFITVDASDPYAMGLQIGKRFGSLIKNRISNDPVLHSRLMPFATSDEGKNLIQSLSVSNQ